MNRILIIAVTILIGVVTLLTYQLERERNEVGRLSANQTALIEDVTYFRTQDSLSVASVHKLTLTLKEFKRLNKSRADSIKSLGYKLSRINSIQAVKTETILAIKAPLKDSTLINNLDTLTAPCFHYTSRFIEISGCIIQNEFKGEIKSRVELDIIAHKIPKRFWFIKWGTKAVKVDVVSRDRSCRVVYNGVVEVR